MPRTRRQFVYHPPTPEQIARKRLWLRLWPKWDDAIYEAYKGNTAQLDEYLRSDLALDGQQRNELADLLARRIQHQSRRGRKSGAIPSPAAKTQSLWLAHARHRLRLWTAANGGRLPPGAYRVALEEVGADLAAEDGLKTLGDIDIEVMLKELRRGRRARARRRP